MHHYDPFVVADEGTGRPLVGVRAEVVDAETLAPVTTYRDGEPVPLISGPHGLIAAFQTDETTRRVQITAGQVTLHRWCVEFQGPPPDTGPHPALFLDTGATPHSLVNWVRREGNRVTLAVGWSAGPSGSARVFTIPEWASTASGAPLIAPVVGGGYMYFVGTACIGYQLVAGANQYVHATWHTDAPFPSDTDLTTT